MTLKEAIKEHGKEKAIETLIKQGIEKDKATEMVDKAIAEDAMPDIELPDEKDAKIKSLEEKEKELQAIIKKYSEQPDYSKMPSEKQEDPTRGFKSLAEQAYEVVKFRTTGKMDERLEPLFVESKAAGTGPDGLSGPAGAFLMAPQWSADLLTSIMTEFPIIGRTRSIPLRQGNVINMPALVSYDENSNTYFNGIAVYRRAEKRQLTASAPEWAMIELKCEELVGMTAPTNEMMRRTPEAVEVLLNQMFKYAIGKTVTREIIKGTGAGGQLLGLINAACRFAMTVESGQVRSTDPIYPQNLTHMIEHLTDDATSPCWIMHPTMMTPLTFAAASLGLSGQLMNWYDPKSNTLLDFPVFKSFACSAPGTEGDIILTDLGMYLRAFESDGDQWDVSEHFYFDYNQTAFRIITSNDGQPWWMSTKLEEDGVTYTSPIVTLATS